MTNHSFDNTILECLATLGSSEKEMTGSAWEARRALIRAIDTVGIGNEDSNAFEKVLVDALMDLKISKSGGYEFELEKAYERIKRICDGFSDYLDGEVASFLYGNEFTRNEIENTLCEGLIVLNTTYTELLEKQKAMVESHKTSPSLNKAFEMSLELMGRRINETIKEREDLRLLIHLVELEGRRNNLDDVIGLSDAKYILQNVTSFGLVSKYLNNVFMRLREIEEENEKNILSLAEVTHG